MEQCVDEKNVPHITDEKKNINGILMQWIKKKNQSCLI